MIGIPKQSHISLFRSGSKEYVGRRFFPPVTSSHKRSTFINTSFTCGNKDTMLHSRATASAAIVRVHAQELPSGIRLASAFRFLCYSVGLKTYTASGSLTWLWDWTVNSVAAWTHSNMKSFSVLPCRHMFPVWEQIFAVVQHFKQRPLICWSTLPHISGWLSRKARHVLTRYSRARSFELCNAMRMDARWEWTAQDIGGSNLPTQKTNKSKM